MFDSQTVLDHAAASRKRLDTLYRALNTITVDQAKEFKQAYEWFQKEDREVIIRSNDGNQRHASYTTLTHVPSIFTRIFYDDVLCNITDPTDDSLERALAQNKLLTRHEEVLTDAFCEFIGDYAEGFDERHQMCFGRREIPIVYRMLKTEDGVIVFLLDVDCAHVDMFLRISQMTRPGAWCIFTTPQELVLAYETAVLFEMTDHLPALVAQLDKNLSDGFCASLPHATEFNARTSRAMKFQAAPPKKEMSIADQLRANTLRLQEETKAREQQQKEEEEEVPDSDEDDDQDRDEDE